METHYPFWTRINAEIPVPNHLSLSIILQILEGGRAGTVVLVRLKRRVKYYA